jgi:hypothetical protein
MVKYQLSNTPSLAKAFFGVSYVGNNIILISDKENQNDLKPNYLLSPGKDNCDMISDEYKNLKRDSSIVDQNGQPQKEKSTILTAGLMMTNACLGTTIFTFALKAKTFGLVWLLVAAVVVGIINYWSGKFKMCSR